MAVALAASMTTPEVATAATATAPGVLLLYDERTDLPGLAMIDASLTRELKARTPVPVELYRESLDLSRFGSGPYRALTASYLAEKYAGHRVDVVVAVLGPSLDFLLAHRDRLLPGVPIVFCGIDRRELGARALPPGVTGVLLKREFAPTVEVALDLQPETERAFVIAGTSEFDQNVLEQLRGELRRFEGRLDVVYLTGRSFARILDEVSKLPPRSIVLHASFFRDAEGKPFVPHEAVEQIADASDVPVYGFVDQFLGRGIVGGRLYSLSAHGAEAGRLALRVVSGTSAAELPPIEPRSSVIQFDARELRRWGLDEARLPTGAEVLFRPTSLWTDYRAEVIVAAIAFAVMAALLFGLVIQGGRRRRAEAELRESESRFRTVADRTPVMLWLADAEENLTFVNHSWLAFTGNTRDGEIGENWTGRVHPDDLPTLRERSGSGSATGSSLSMECRLRRWDGEYVWVLLTKTPRFAVDGQFLGFIGSCMDLSEQKEAAREMQRSRVELAHATRVATMGELTAALAHELKQPLTAILANAEAAAMILDSDGPRLEEVREILADIRGDDERAAEIITRLRRLLEKHDLARAPMAINAAAEDVLRLLGAEAAERGVAMHLEPAADLPAVSGDRIHLQQVLMNLVLNGLDAMAALPEGDRRLVVRTGRSRDGGVEIIVTDRGPGVSAARLSRLFEPFASTKKGGLGMGLSISRTIVEAHEGRIWAENEVSGGASFHVELPALDAGTAESGQASH